MNKWEREFADKPHVEKKSVESYRSSRVKSTPALIGGADLVSRITSENVRAK